MDKTTIQQVKARIESYKAEIERDKRLIKADEAFLETLLEDHEHDVEGKFCTLCGQRVVCQECDNPYDQDADSFGVCMSCWKTSYAYGKQ